MTVWFTSDQHYGHANIIPYCKRPFRDVEHMEAEMVRRFAAVVKPDDTVYFLGDFSFTNPLPVLQQLPGKKYLILGNHDWDERRRKQLGKSGAFGWIKDVELIEVEDQELWLSHYPHLSWPNSHHGSWNLHGHMHGTSPAWWNAVDVGVDCWNYSPVSFATIFEHMHHRQTAQRPEKR